MTPQILRLKEAGIRGLIFNGDFDMACNYLGNQWFVEALGYNVSDGFMYIRLFKFDACKSMSYNHFDMKIQHEN